MNKSGMNGSVQTFTAPVDGWYHAQLWGADGGSDCSDDPDRGRGGSGAYIESDIYMKAHETVYVYVGQNGSAWRNTWNGNKYETIYSFNYNVAINNIVVDTLSWTYTQVAPLVKGVSDSGAGGGATDLRIINSDWDNYNGLTTRFMVAGGGGGGGYFNHHGGHGGTLVGGNGVRCPLCVSGYGGTQTNAGAGGYGAAFGIGGSQSMSWPKTMVGDTVCNGSAGGGGWYGGGGSESGSATSNSGCDASGGGGSSYIKGYPGCSTQYTNTQKWSDDRDIQMRNQAMLSGDSYMTLPNGSSYVWKPMEDNYDKQSYARILLISRD